jgi:hypothetical protein
MRQKPGAAKIRNRAATAAHSAQARNPSPVLIREDSPEFAAARREAIKRVVAKGRFKWSSQRLMRSYDDPIEAASLRSFW